MTITAILADKDISASDKLTGVNEIIDKIRAKYGNADVTVDIPYVNTVDGEVRLSTLNDEDKLAILEQTIKNIKLHATEMVDQNDAVIFDREIERMIATDNVLINITASLGSAYL